MTSTIGIPIKLLNEATVCDNLAAVLEACLGRTACWSAQSQGHIVTVEISSGQVYRGKLLEGASDIEPLAVCARPREASGILTGH